MIGRKRKERHGGTTRHGGVQGTPALRRLGQENHRVLETMAFWRGLWAEESRGIGISMRQRAQILGTLVSIFTIPHNPCYPLLTSQILLFLLVSFYLLFGDSVTKAGLELKVITFLPLSHMCRFYDFFACTADKNLSHP